MFMTYRNSEGYSDPTAGAALAAVKKEEKEHQQVIDERRVHDLMKALKYIIRSAGFELTERIQLKDKDTGKVYR